jgi:5-methylcytosine-specific restriction enzyme A
MRLPIRSHGLRVTAHGAPRVYLPGRDPGAFYQSPEWRALVARLVEAQGRICQQCGRAVPVPFRLFGHHIVERRDGGASLDERNVRLLCGRCHNRITAENKAARAAARW